MGKFLVLTGVSFVALIICTIFAYSKYAEGKRKYLFYAGSGVLYLLTFLFALLWVKDSFKDYPETISFIYGITASILLMVLGFLLTPLFRRDIKIKFGLSPIEYFILFGWLMFTIFACMWASKAYEKHDPNIAVGSAFCLSVFRLACILPFYIKPYGNLAIYIDLVLIFAFGLAFILLAIKESRVILNNEKTLLALLNLI